MLLLFYCLMSNPTQTAITAVKVDPAREYVAGSSAWLLYRDGVQALPTPVDSVEAELGDQSYTRMLTDAQVAANLNLLIASVLDGDLLFEPAALADDDPALALAEEIAAYARRMLEDLDPSIDDVLWDLCESALAYGLKVAEITWELATVGADAGRYILSSLKPRPRDRFALVVDRYMNVLGILAAAPGQALAYRGPLRENQRAEVLPRSKFAALAFHPRDGDPRGRTILRAAYNPWWLKTQGWPEYLKYMMQFGTPSIIGETAPEATGDPATGMSAEDLLLSKLLAFQNGTAIAVPPGTRITTLIGASAAGNDVFPLAAELFDSQITKAMLGVTRATQEAQYGSKADSGTAKSMLDGIVRQLRTTLVRMLRRDVLLPLVEVNFGPAAVLSLLPRVLLGGAMGIGGIAGAATAGAGGAARSATSSFVRAGRPKKLSIA